MANQSANPFNGRSFRAFDEITDEKCEARIATAAKGFDTSRRRSRAAIVAKASVLMGEREDELARTDPMPILESPTKAEKRLWGGPKPRLRLAVVRIFRLLANGSANHILASRFR